MARPILMEENVTTRQPAPVLKLNETQVDRPKVEFKIRRTVDQEDDNGEVRPVDETSVDLFQVKLHSELTLGDYEEVNRLQEAFHALTQQRGELEDSEWLLQLTFNYRRLMEVAFYDEVPHEAVYGLTLERMEQITDFLFDTWPESVKQKAALMRGREPAATP